MAKFSVDHARNTGRDAADAAYLATVSTDLLQDWLQALQTLLPAQDYAATLRTAALSADASRATHDQIVTLYRQAVAHSGDEMMGLWSRPIRIGALKYLCTILLSARSLGGALHRFVQYWNLLLDDAQLQMGPGSGLALVARDGARLNRFGQMLILKLAHGLLSWLAGRELAVQAVQFSFARPAFAGDYAVIFPAPVRFAAGVSALHFPEGSLDQPVVRPAVEMAEFLARAPRDWIFTRHCEHALHLQLRALLHSRLQPDFGLQAAAAEMGMSARTLSRSLAREGLSFQGIKDALRRDIAIRDLGGSAKSVDTLSWELGFSSVAVFTRAFRAWTGETPAAFRRRARALPAQPAVK